MWIDDFVNDLFPIKAGDVRRQRAIALKDQHIPRYLYKYRAFNDNALENLKNGTLWAAEPASLNDATDSWGSFDTSKILPAALRYAGETGGMPSLGTSLGVSLTEDDAGEIGRATDPMGELLETLGSRIIPGWHVFRESRAITSLKRVVADVMQDLGRHFSEKFRSTVKIISLSERNDCEVMWGHYGDGHRGFCIEYDFSGSLNDFYRKHVFPVIYRETLLDISEYLGEPKNFNNYFPIYAAMVKKNAWHYEREWRIIIPFGLCDEEMNIAMPRITRIFLGAKFPAEKIETVQTIASCKPCEIVRMWIDQKTGEVHSNASSSVG